MFVLEMHRAYNIYVTCNVFDGVVPIFFNPTVSQVNCSNQGMGAVCHQRQFDLPDLKPHLHALKQIGMARQIFGTVARLPVPRLPPGGGLGTPKILSTGATLHLGPIRLHVEDWECRALKSSARCQNLACRADFFSACKWGLI